MGGRERVDAFSSFGHLEASVPSLCDQALLYRCFPIFHVLRLAMLLRIFHEGIATQEQAVAACSELASHTPSPALVDLSFSCVYNRVSDGIGPIGCGLGPVIMG